MTRGPDPHRLPQTIGSFRVRSVLGAGAAGVVYEAEDGDHRVALKVLHAFAMSPTNQERFGREAHIRIDHPNIVRVLDQGVADGSPYIAFELIEGETLADRLERGSLPIAEVIDIGIQVCNGLSAAHEARVIHRDLKPSNIYLSRDGTVKILDFGIALLLDRARLTRAQEVIGTPAYLSPEQASGAGEVDERTDIWSLGAVLYECLSCRRAFGRSNTAATLLAVIREDPPKLSGIPQDLMTSIKRALCKDRAGRWSDPSRFAAHLRALALSEEPRRTSAPVLIAAEERRFVAVLMAESVCAYDRIEQEVTDRGGLFVPLRNHRAVGLFGGRIGVGDEVTRAAEAALSCRAAAGTMAIAAGHAEQRDSMIASDALAAAGEGCRMGCEHVAVDASAASALRGRCRSIGEGLFELVPEQEGSQDLQMRSFVGREPETEQLALAVSALHETSRAQVIQVTGPPGSGKTRLSQELGPLLRQGTRLFVGQVPPNRQRFAVFTDLLSTHIRRSGRPSSEALTTLAQQAAVDGAKRCAARLAQICSVAPPESSAADQQVVADRSRGALIDLFQGLCHSGPLALVLDGMQWVDDASLQLVSDLLERLSDQPLLVLVTSRAALSFARDSSPIEIRLQGLGAADVHLLAASVAGRSLEDRLIRAITKQTEGNPLFVEQIVLALQEQALLDELPKQLPLPGTIVAAIQSRLDDLPAAEKELVKRASILELPFTSDDLRALEAQDVVEGLSALVRKGILRRLKRDRGSKTRTYSFRSQLIAEVAYEMIGQQSRLALHRRAAAYSSSVDAPSSVIARHHERGGQPKLAAEQYLSGTLVAAHRGDGPTVLELSDRALRLGVDVSSRFALHMARSEAQQFLNNFRGQYGELESALVVADSPLERARVFTEKIQLGLRSGEQEEALAAAENAVRAARLTEDKAMLAMALGRRAVALAYGGQPEAALQVLEEAQQISHSESVSLRAFAMTWVGQVAAVSGDLGARIAAFQRAAVLHREAEDLRRSASAEVNLADAYNRIGAYADAARSLDAALSSCKRVGNRAVAAYALVNLGYSLTMLGQSSTAIATLDEVSARAEAGQEMRLAMVARIYRARAQLDHAPPALVAEEAERAAAAAEEVGSSSMAASAYALAARAWLSAKEVERADALSEKAMALRNELGGVEEDEGEIFLLRAQVWSAKGEPDRANEVIASARARLFAIASRIKDQQIRERFRQDVPAHRAILKW